jgi:hypothetical protein
MEKFICKICKKEFKSSRGLANHIRSHNISNYDYSLKYNYNGIVPTCACGCGEPMKWMSLGTGFKKYKQNHDKKKKDSRIIKKCLFCGKEFESYVCDNRSYCSLECRSKDPKMWDKHKKTMNDKYGVDNIFQSKEFIEKNIQYMKDNYDGIGMASEIISDKVKQTNIKNLGVDNIFKSQEFIEKNIQYMKDNYDGIGFSSPIIKEKIDAIIENKYGTKYIMQNEQIKDKVKETNRKKFFKLLLTSDRLKNKLNIFDPELTEWENMQLNNYDRIWDCGNLIFEYIG